MTPRFDVDEPGEGKSSDCITCSPPLTGDRKVDPGRWVVVSQAEKAVCRLVMLSGGLVMLQTLYQAF